uniref:Uncharacterized protein n=1 Tax=Ditylum brightwellii TaxID=49249 RepID=A0A7S4QUI9_9STRA
MKICKHQHRRGLLCVISLLLIAVTIAVLKIMMDLPGRIDALLLASRKCIIVSENETRKQDAASSFMVANATTSFVGNNEKYYHVDDNDDFIDDVIWNVFFEGSNDGSDKEEDFDRNHDTNQWSELHPACRSYRKLRARVRYAHFFLFSSVVFNVDNMMTSFFQLIMRLGYCTIISLLNFNLFG